ncbi:MAG TPA: hypothetical protein DCZ41_04360 [Firmicutes bacterium]|nr:hypothetical protein [Bacillota bacterium]
MNESHAKKKTRYVLAFVALAMFLLGASCFFVNTRFLLDDGENGISNLTFFSWAFAFFLYAIGIFIFAKKHCYIRKWWLAALLLFPFLICGLLGLFFFDSYQNGEIVYAPDFVAKLRAGTRLVLLFLSIYCFLAILPSFSRGDRVYSFCYRVISLCCLVGILYSYIVEKDVYAAAFASNISEFSSHPVLSFTSNRNIYGCLLFFGLVSESFLIRNRRRLYHWALYFFYYINLFCPCSKTCIVLGFCYSFCFLVYFLCSSIKKHWFRASLPLFFFVALHVLAAVLGCLQVDSFFEPIHHFLKRIISRGSFGEYGSFMARFYQFKDCYHLVSSNPMASWFGFGGILGRSVYGAFNGNPYAYVCLDSSWGSALLEGGFVGFALLFLLWCYIFAKVIGSIVHRNKYGWLYLFLFFCLLARSFMEQGDPIYFNFSGLAVYGMLLLPLLSQERYERRLALGIEEETIVIEKNVPKTRTKPAINMVFGLSFPLFVGFLSIFFAIYSWYPIPFFTWKSVFASLGILYFLATFSFYFICRAIYEKKPFQALLYVLYFALAAVSSVLSCCFLKNHEPLYVSLCLILLLFILFLSGKGWRLMEGQWLSTLYFLLLSFFLVSAFTLLNYYSLESPSKSLLFGEIAIVFVISSLNTFFLEGGSFPAWGSFFDSLERRILPLSTRIVLMNDIKRKL